MGPGTDGEPVDIGDPSAYVAEINTTGLPKFRNNEPGIPVGRVIAAELFTSPAGVKFAAVIFGIYEDQQRVSFASLGLDPIPVASSPAVLEELNDGYWLDFGTDPREVDTQWTDEVVQSAPLRVERIDLSHNAAEAPGELLRIGLAYMVLVWNPFVTAIATEAGKSTYAGIHHWLERLWNKVSELRNPIVDVQSYQDGCRVSFLFRGKDVKRHYAAHEALPIAAAQAAKLIAGLKAKRAAPVFLVYEFDEPRWFPSYALLADGRIVSDRALLIATEQLPMGLSIGSQKRRNN